MLADKQAPPKVWRPWEADELDWKWGAVVALVAATSMFFVSMLGVLVGVFLMETSFDTPFWWFAIGGAFPALAGFVTGLVGGARSWWRLVPVGALYLIQGVYVLVGDTEWWVLLVTWAAIVASTWLARVASR